MNEKILNDSTNEITNTLLSRQELKDKIAEMIIRIDSNYPDEHKFTTMTMMYAAGFQQALIEVMSGRLKINIMEIENEPKTEKL